ncbi:hypothetical protein AKJ09_06333 [Labilithrix luteola]|uniref:BNR repeat domain protein n=1 Tax=Labilithrix luteola TaxID=1391654 RepID=A0A0K1Q2Q4_9BACT|nr:hypothetical protein AKJ09_06333 [Labilithrix luteola]
MFVLAGSTAWTASCSSDGDSDRGDGGVLASDDAGPEASSQDATTDTSTPAVDAGPVDAAPLPVVCTSKPCALSLVTTFGVSDERSEGYCARLDDGTVACWGGNGDGQLGRGDDAGVDDDPTPRRVLGVSNVVALDHTCAVDGSGGVHCWGTGPFLRDDAGVATTERTAVTLPLPPVTNIGVGPVTACATTSDGVLCWGRNDDGQVAPFGAEPRFDALTPRLVALPAGAKPRSLAVARASFAIGQDGTMVSWGANPPLARSSSLSPDPYPLPVALGAVSSVDVIQDNACATAGGTGYCWGAVTPKYLDPEGVSLLLRAMPTPVVAPEPLTRIATTRNIVIDNLGTRIVQPQRWCACGRSGAVYCAGYNASGQAGDGTKDFAYQAVKVRGLPEPAADVKATPDATCALLTSGKIYCWGSDYYGQLGTGEIKVPSLEPKEVRLP